MFGKYETEYGIRMGTTGKPVWYASKSERDGKLRGFNKNAKKGKESKAIQRQVKVTSNSKIVKKVQAKLPSNDCKGGKCKPARNKYCDKHLKAAAIDMKSVHLPNGKNRNTARWDEPGHRW